MIVDGVLVRVVDIPDITEKEVSYYIKQVELKPYEKINRLVISKADEERVCLDAEIQPPKFERIRRITGYLVGTIDRWNNAKRAEERDRVKHGMGGIQPYKGLQGP